MPNQPIDYFSTAADYVKGASSFFLNVFEIGASGYERVRDRIETLKDPSLLKPSTTTSFFSSFATVDKDKVLGFLAVAIIAGGLIIASRK